MGGFWHAYVWPGAIIVGQVLLIVVPLLIAVAYLTYAERKVIGAIHLRYGPNVVGPFGLLQPIADGLKLLTKETVLPARADTSVFLLAPVATFTLSFLAWAVIPFDEGWVLSDINVGILFLFAVASLEVYGVLMAGWASNSRYAFLGALRSAAQMVSYEVSMGFGHHYCTDLCWQPQSERDRGGAEGHVVRRSTISDVRDLLYFRPGGDQPPSIRPAGG